MSKGADSPGAESRSFIGEIEDFGQSALYTALVSPINGCIQIIDHTADVHLPVIIGAPEHDSIGAKAGMMVGAAVDLVALSIVTGGVADLIGATGAVGGLAAAAATGAIYGGVLTPSDNNSKSFVADRLENGAIGAATFVAMSGAAQGLGATGVFAVPEARSLMGSLAFGGLTGAAGGAVSAEATALLKEHKAIPSAGEFAGSVASNALFGATYGGLGYAYNQLTGPASRPKVINSKEGQITTYNDSQGQPVKFKSVVDLPSYDDDGKSVQSAISNVTVGTKMTNGRWKATTTEIDKATGQPEESDATFPKEISKVVTNRNGSVSVVDSENNTQTFSPGKLNLSNPVMQAKAASADFAKENFDRTNLYGNHEISSSKGGLYEYDQSGKLVHFGEHASTGNWGAVEYDAGGQISNIVLKSSDWIDGVSLTRTGTNQWQYSDDHQVYNWKGSIEPVQDPTSGQATGLSIRPEGGKPISVNTHSQMNAIASSIKQAGVSQGLEPDFGYARATADGGAVLRASEAQALTVNGKPATGEVTVKPGDSLKMMVDVGDQYTIMENERIPVTRSEDGHTVVGTTVVDGDKPLDLGRIGVDFVFHPTQLAKR